MDFSLLEKVSNHEWRLPRSGAMRVPGVLYASQALIRDMDDAVAEQLRGVAELPGIVGAALAMPDAHWGYGFPIGGVAAFDPKEGGIISAGGVGFDIACGVRTLRTGLHEEDILARQGELADLLFARIPAGVGSTGMLKLNMKEMDRMLRGGAEWAVSAGYGEAADLSHAEEGGRMDLAEPDKVSDHAKKRQQAEMGTLGSGNHYLEVQAVDQVYEADAAVAYGLSPGAVVVSIHCGSRGLGHQVATDYGKRMVNEAARAKIKLRDRELAYAPLDSDLGQAYFGAMNAAINCALGNRQVLTHLARLAFAELFPRAALPLLYDVCHNTAKLETHVVDGKKRRLLVHRKGATRAFGPGHPSLPPDLRPAGQPVFIGGSMGTASYILAGTEEGMSRSFGSACHGAGRAMSRKQATKRWKGREVVEQLHRQGVEIRTTSFRGVAEEAPGAYKDVAEVVEATRAAGLARIVARVRPLVCVKG
ncbi:MAG: RtcB family protein [Thermodesulfobacteriota bacterium]